MTTHIDKLSGNCKDFAISCYEQNSISELADCGLANIENADDGDMEAWGITQAEWALATEAAFKDLVAERVEPEE